MRDMLLSIYQSLILRRPLVCLVTLVLALGALGFFSRDFHLDASAESLMLKNDRTYEAYRLIRARYGSDDFLIVTYTPDRALFSAGVLADLRRLRDQLRDLQGVDSVTSLLDVPLIVTSGVSLNDFQGRIPTLDDAGIDPQQAREELLHSPLYRNRILSPDGRTTALQVDLEVAAADRDLKQRRTSLLRSIHGERIPPDLHEKLDRLDAEIRAGSTRRLARQGHTIAAIRQVLEAHRDTAELHLGGVPMIVTDMIGFIRHDLRYFGLGVLGLVLGMLWLIFRRPRWTILPLACCLGAPLAMLGLLGLSDWRVTVVSSNFPPILIILTLSMTVHLIVRYHEVQTASSGADQLTLVRETVASKAIPCLYTSLTTIVAFSSLIFSDIQPVIDFGWMMAIGLGIALLLCFSLFPAVLALLRPVAFTPRLDLTGRIVGWSARLVISHPWPTLAGFALLGLLSIVGMTRLTVQSRFIDHFKQSTEIYQGMELIDRQLGGTVPLDVLVDAPPRKQAGDASETQPAIPNDPFTEAGGTAGFTAQSYWYNSLRLKRIAAIQAALEKFPATGKVLSLATTRAVLKELNGGKSLPDWLLAVIYKKMPDAIKAQLLDPYLAPDGDQARLAVRVQESQPGLQRDQLLRQIRRTLAGDLDLTGDRVHLNGLFVLYNNLLHSLFSSQIKALALVFCAILGMFLILFRSLRPALIAIAPNLLAAAVVLGLLGWLHIPLDIMTITVASIAIGIAADDTIHYVHRFRREARHDRDYPAVVRRCHESVGRAMYYTSLIIICGFAILTFSSFMPTIYFGLLTGLAMLVAVVADLTLLPLLLIRFAGDARKSGQEETPS